MTKQTRQLMLAATARFGWKVWKGDVTGAFLQDVRILESSTAFPVTKYAVQWASTRAASRV